MQTWSQVKAEKKPPGMNDLIDEMLKRRNDNGGDGDIFSEKQNAELLEKKMQRRRERNYDK